MKNKDVAKRNISQHGSRSDSIDEYRLLDIFLGIETFNASMIHN